MVPDVMGCEFVVDPLKSQFSENIYGGCGTSIGQGRNTTFNRG